MGKKRFFGRSANRPTLGKIAGCDNGGNPIPKDGPFQIMDKNGQVFAEVGTMEPEIQAELDRILKDVPVPEAPKE